MAGISPTGFSKKSLAEIKAELEDSFKASFGQAINLQPGSVFSQIIGIYAERESLIWDLSQEVYNSQYPDTAEGVNLDNVVAITGTERLPARRSAVQRQLFFGTVGTIVPAGTIIDVPSNPSARFVTDADSPAFVAGVDEVQDIDFSAVPASGSWKLNFGGQQTTSLAFNANAAAVQAALNALGFLSGVTVSGNYTAGFTVTFAGADGKQDQDLLVVVDDTLLDGGAAAVAVTVVETTVGVPQSFVSMTAEEYGPIPAPRATLTQIVTPVAGLTTTKNAMAAIVGRDVETDAELRLRRMQELQKAGAGTVEAIRAKLLDVDGVTQAIVFENDSMMTDSDGLPPKSFRAFVQGGLDEDIGQAIWESKPAGIATSGTELEVITDSQGINHNIRFSRPVVKAVYISVELTKDIASFPSTGAAMARTALADYINSLQIGEDVIVYPKLICTLDAIPGVTDIRIGIAFTPAPPLTGADNNLVIGVNEVAKVLDPNADIVVTVI